MKRLEVSGALRPIYGSLGVKRLNVCTNRCEMSVAPFLQEFHQHDSFTAPRDANHESEFQI